MRASSRPSASPGAHTSKGIDEGWARRARARTRRSARPIRPRRKARAAGHTRRSATRSCTSPRSSTRRNAPPTTSGSTSSRATWPSAKSTPSLSYIVPDRCHDGNPTPCTAGAPAGLAPANAFLKQVVPEITRSKAYRESGLLVITVDQAPSSGEFADSSSCCGQPLFPNAPAKTLTGAPSGGGAVGALLLSPFVKAGTTSQEPYNHFSLLRTIEDLFRLPHLGYAGLSAVEVVRSRRCSPPARADRRRSRRRALSELAARAAGERSDAGELAVGDAVRRGPRCPSTHSSAIMWRGSCRSAGCRSRRSVLVGSSEPARTSDGESTRLSGPVPARLQAGASEPTSCGCAPPASCGCVRCTRSSPAHQLKRYAQRLAQRRRVGIGGRDEAVGLDAGELQHAPAGVDGAPRLLASSPTNSPSRRLRARASSRRAEPPCAGARAGSRAGRSRRRARRRSISQLDHLRRALAERVQVARRDHEQRDAVDAVVVEPVADQRAALERRRLDVVQRDGDRGWAVGRAHGGHRGRALRRRGCSLRRAGRRVGAREPTQRAVAVGEPLQRALPGAPRAPRAGRRARGARAAAASRRARAAPRRARSASGAHSRPLTRCSISDSGPPRGDRDHRQAAGLRLEDDLAEGVGGAREQEDVGARVGARELVALEPAEEASRARRGARAGAPARGRRRRAPGAGAGIARARARRKASASRSTPFSRVMRPA